MSESDSSHATIIVDAVVDKPIGLDMSKKVIKLTILAILVNSSNVDFVMVPNCGAISAAAKKFEVSKHVASLIFLRARAIYLPWRDSSLHRESQKRQENRQTLQIKLRRGSQCHCTATLPPAPYNGGNIVGAGYSKNDNPPFVLNQQNHLSSQEWLKANSRQSQQNPTRHVLLRQHTWRKRQWWVVL
jgi:hypothetical protein